MSEQTIERLTQKLIRELECHPHLDELVALITDQLIDDECVDLDRAVFSAASC